MPTFKRILVPVDGSATAKTALATALELARESGATVRLTHCLDELPYLSGYEYSGVYLDQARQGAERVLCDALALCQAAGVKADTRLVAQSAQRLGETVSNEARDWRADLVVVGTHGRRGMGRVLLGSGAEQIIRHANVPVLTVRGPGKAS